MNGKDKRYNTVKMTNSPNNTNNSTENNGEEPSIVMVQCEDCGHRLPEVNMAIHRATCHTYHRRMGPTIHREQQRGAGGDGGSSGEAIDAVDESIAGDYVATPSRQPSATGAATATSPSTTAGAVLTGGTAALALPPTVAPQNHWACPRCTLHNPISSNTCDACLYQQRGSQQQDGMNINNNNNNQRMHVNVTEVDPQAVGRVVAVAGWSLFGAIVGGPVGAFVAGGTAAAVSGVQHHLQERRRRQLNNGNVADNPGHRPFHRPFVAITTRSYTSTPWGGTTMSVTSNASGQRRTMTIRDVGGRQGMSPADQRILQMLMSNAISQGAATPKTVNQMTFEDLLQQFGFPTDDDDHNQHNRSRGATPELINQRSYFQTLDIKEAIEELEENQSMCNICLEEFKRGDEMRKLNHCSHAFHKECIDRWLSQVASCPICKNELNSQRHQQQQENNDDGSSSATRNSTGSSSS